MKENPGFEIIGHSTCPCVKRVNETADFAASSSLAISCVNIPLSLAAYLGNLVILITLRKATSINAPTKLLFLNLALTDLCVGLVSEPLFSFHLMSIALKRWDHCRFT